MTGSGKWCRSVCLVALVIGVSGLTGQAQGDASADDGWRRTAHGWERIDSWTRAEATSLHNYRFDVDHRPTSVDERRDFHPLVLVVLQVLIGGVALFLLSPNRRSNGDQTPLSIVPGHRRAA
jgi:hypothetical protein